MSTDQIQTLTELAENPGALVALAELHNLAS